LARVVPVTVIDRLELAAVDGYQRLRKQIQPPAMHHELAADLADRSAIVFAEVCDRLEVGRPSTVSHISSIFRCASRSRRRLDCTRLRQPYM
jgi:hypothetical protein